MAASMCRMRPLFQTLFNEKRILFSNLVSRTYIIPPLNYVTTFKHKFPQNGVVVRCQEMVLNGSALNIRFFSSEKKLTTEEISEKVLHICKIFDKIPGDKLTLEAHFMNDLGLDSLDHVELIMNIEDDFDFEIPDGDAEKLLRPRDIVAYIEQKEQAKQ